MTEDTVIRAALYAAALIYAGPMAYFDDNSTLEFLKRHLAPEAGKWGFMASLQAKYPKGWTWIKAGLMAAIAAAVAFGFPTLGRHLHNERLGQFLALAILIFLNLFEYMAIIGNYNLGKRK